jgi:hypothetical protein
VQVDGQIEPLKVVKALPDDLELPNLTERLVSLMKRFRTTVLLKQQCNNIIDADCMAIAERLLQRAQEPLRHIHMWDGKKGTWELYDSLTATSVPCDPPQIPPDAINFSTPKHTHNLPMRMQVAAHMMVEHEAQQLVRQEAATIHRITYDRPPGAPPPGLTIWTEDVT